MYRSSVSSSVYPEQNQQNYDHMRRMRMIESQRITYLPDHHRIHSGRRYYDSGMGSYPVTHSVIGQLNRQLQQQTQIHRYREALKRSNVSERRSSASSSIYQAKNEETFNPHMSNSNQQYVISKPASEYGVLNGKNVGSSNYKNPSSIKLGQLYGDGSNSHNSILRGPILHSSNLGRPRFDPTHHYFPVRSPEQQIDFLTKNSVLKNSHFHQPYQYPESDRPIQYQQTTPLYDMKFNSRGSFRQQGPEVASSPTVLKSPVVSTSPVFKSKQQQTRIKNERAKASLNSGATATTTSLGMVGNVTSMLNKLDTQSKVLTMLILIMGVLILVLQVIQ